MRFLALSLALTGFMTTQAQTAYKGVLSGNVLDERKKPLEGASVQIFLLSDTTVRQSIPTDKDGSFSFSALPMGYHRLKISFAGYAELTLDSIHLREERFDFNLNDLTLQDKEALSSVVVYAERPLIESKDGNITFNASESALSAGSNASELLTNVPLITKDPSGKLLVRGREPKILIDDKPVELNADQLQDLLESMPGNTIEKIEVLTNPPPRYANEPGGVINIVTKKGKVGRSGRITVYAGSRGEQGVNGSFLYRKGPVSLTVNGGGVNRKFEGDGYSKRKNIYQDSTSFFNTQSNYANQSMRPNLRANLDYDLNKQHALNLVIQFNENGYENFSGAEYRNLNRLGDTYKLSNRDNSSSGNNLNPDLALNYTFRSNKPGEVFRLYSSTNYSYSESLRDVYQRFLQPDYSLISDSVQRQNNTNRSNGYNIRLSYDLPLNRQQTLVSVGGYHILNHSHNAQEVSSKRKGAQELEPIDSLGNDFHFYQHLTNLRASVKQMVGRNFSLTGGVSAEATQIAFQLPRTASDTSNHYWSWLPFFNVNKSWESGWNINAAYRRTIGRPGINELNPTRDNFDPYNTRFGNPGLEPSFAHNFDLGAGRTKNGFYANVGVGYNRVENIFNQIRNRVSDSKTEITWQNISSRQEYEASTWSGYTINKKLRINLSASYIYNKYSAYDKINRKYRDGGTLTSNLNSNYTWKDLYSVNGSFTFNRFANPQGTVRSTVSMNLGLQGRLLRKKLTVTLNMIDPFLQLKNRSYTYGTNYELESYNSTITRNFRLSLSYNLLKSPPRKPAGKQINRQQLQKMMSRG